MSEQENNVAPGMVQAEDDTRTRKTVRLRPSGAVEAPAAPVPQLADPLSGRNTNTGNLEILNDTQTRRTVKLKPLVPNSAKAPAAPVTVAPVAPPPAPAAAPAPPGGFCG